VPAFTYSFPTLGLYNAIIYLDADEAAILYDIGVISSRGAERNAIKNNRYYFGLWHVFGKHSVFS
jgi:hypothetical protein